MKYKIHKELDALWKEGGMKRADVYRMMKNFLGGKDFHVADLNETQCELILKRIREVKE